MMMSLDVWAQQPTNVSGTVVNSTTGQVIAGASVSGGGQTVDDYLKKLKAILNEKGASVSGGDAKLLFTDGGGRKLLAKAAEERAKLPPVTKADFKAQLTGVAVCDARNRKFGDLEFSIPESCYEVPTGKIAVFRVEYDFPKGYPAAVWVRGRGSLFSNPSGRYPGKGVAYGFLGLHDTKQDLKLDSITIQTNCDPELDDYPRGWTICSPKVDLLFRKKDDEARTQQRQEERGEPYVSKSKLHAAYRSKDRNRVFVEVCDVHEPDEFKTPPRTLDRIKEMISLKADIIHVGLSRSKDGVLFCTYENLKDFSGK